MNALYLMRPLKKCMLPIYITAVGTNFIQPAIDRTYPNHQIFYIEKGRALFETAAGTFIIPENHVIFAKADYHLRYRAYDDELYVSFIAIHGDTANTILNHFNAEDFSFYENPSIYQKILACYNHAKKFESAEALSVKAYELFVTYFIDLSKSSISKPVTLAKDFIKKNFQNTISVDDIVRASGVSRTMLFQLFKKEAKCSPMEFLQKTRIERSCNLLLLDDKTKISDIAMDCGFWDTSYFCKVFKAEMGCSPAKFRKNN